jgi:hypothetical protein
MTEQLDVNESATPCINDAGPRDVLPYDKVQMQFVTVFVPLRNPQVWEGLFIPRLQLAEEFSYISSDLALIRAGFCIGQSP